MGHGPHRGLHGHQNRIRQSVSEQLHRLREQKRTNQQIEDARSSVPWQARALRASSQGSRIGCFRGTRASNLSGRSSGRRRPAPRDGVLEAVFRRKVLVEIKVVSHPHDRSVDRAHDGEGHEGADARRVPRVPRPGPERGGARVTRWHNECGSQAAAILELAWIGETRTPEKRSKHEEEEG